MIEQYLASFEQQAPYLPGPAWLTAKRHQALDTFAKLGFPTLRDEHWKYTRLTALENHFFAPFHPPAMLSVAQLTPQLLTDTATHRLVFVDGHYSPTLSQILPSLAEGVTLLNLTAALQDPQIDLEQMLDKTAHLQQQHFRALNTALMSEGAYISIPEYITIVEPIELVFFNATPNSSTHWRNIICLGKNAKANIVERYIGHNTIKNFTNKVTEILLADYAQLDHYSIQQAPEQAIHIGAIHVEQHAYSQFNSYAIGLSGNLVRTDIQVRLLANFAKCQLNGLYLAANKQHIDFHTHIDHLAPDGLSRELYKGIISDRARGVFNGKIQVHPDAQRTDAQLSNQNLLLSRHAEVDTKPELEIYADDVKCSHGATVGQLDETSLFYLRSRGIDNENAQRILTYAFAQEVINTIPQTAIREQLHQLLIQHLFTAKMVKELL